MKIGTDGVLLGAWVTKPSGNNVLDVGCGTGLLSLMMAQRYALSNITAIDINLDAYLQATENFTISSFSSQLTCYWTSFTEFNTPQTYDLIISNPPFFEVDQTTIAVGRKQARQATDFSLEDFFHFCQQHLVPSGRIALVYPTQQAEQLKHIASQYRLHTVRETLVYGHLFQEKPVRSLLEFSFERCTSQTDTLYLETGKRNEYTEDFKSLTRNFYPWL